MAELTKRIPLTDRYMLCIDKFTMWIEELKKGEKGEVWVRVAGYSGTYEGLLRTFAQQKARNTEATKVEGLLREMKQIQNDTIKLAHEIVRKGK